MGHAEKQQLKQEDETFAFNKRQALIWDIVRIGIVIGALIVFMVVAALCVWIIIFNEAFPKGALFWASGLLGVDILGLAGTVLRTQANSAHQMVLTPVTKAASNSRGSPPPKSEVEA